MCDGLSSLSHLRTAPALLSAHLFSLMRLRAILANRLRKLGCCRCAASNAEVTIAKDASFAGSARPHLRACVRNAVHRMSQARTSAVSVLPRLANLQPHRTNRQMPRFEWPIHPLLRISRGSARRSRRSIRGRFTMARRSASSVMTSYDRQSFHSTIWSRHVKALVFAS